MVRRLLEFSKVQKTLTIAGLGPAFLVGCSVHPQAQIGAHAPVSLYKVSIPVPPSIQSMGLNKPAPKALSQTVQTLTSNFGGVAGVSITSIDDGWLISAKGERKMPQQSVSKLWVTMTVLDQIDQGKFTLQTPISITDSDLTVFYQPVASLVKPGQPYQTTVGELIRRSIQMSDNTCNDRLLKLVGGPEAVREFIARKGLGPIRFGPGERLLQAGTAGLEWRQEYSRGNAFSVARSKLSPNVRKAAFEAYVNDPPDGAAPIAIAAAMARLKRGELLSPTSSDWLIQTMSATRTGRARVRAALQPGWSFAHKTGTGQDLGTRTAGFNDVGLLTAPDGRTYGVAILIGDTVRPVRERQLLMQQVTSAIIAHHNS